MPADEQRLADYISVWGRRELGLLVPAGRFSYTH